MFILGVIPARAGSKGIGNKNIYPLCGKLLIEYTIETAMNSNLTDYVISTDCNNILETYSKAMFRPLELCQDNTQMFPVIKHAVVTFECVSQRNVDAVMILQPTSPLRTLEDINKAIELFKSNNEIILKPGYEYKRDNGETTLNCFNYPIYTGIQNDFDSLYSGYYIGIKHKDKLYDKHTDKPHFQRNGAIFITRRDLLDKGQLWSDNVVEFEMPESRSVDIDNLDQMYIAESILKNPREV